MEKRLAVFVALWLVAVVCGGAIDRIGSSSQPVPLEP